MTNILDIRLQERPQLDHTCGSMTHPKVLHERLTFMPSGLLQLRTIFSLAQPHCKSLNFLNSLRKSTKFLPTPDLLI